MGYDPQIILAGRKLIDEMPNYISNFEGKLDEIGVRVDKSKILILGLTFKENCPDVRNTKVSDLVLNLLGLGAQVDIYDPLINLTDVSENMSERIVLKPKSRHYDAVLLTVPVDKFLDMGEKW